MAKAAEQGNTQAANAQDDEAYIAKVVGLYNRSGAGGDITICRVQLRHNNRSIVRAVMGPVRIGDELSLRECDREARASR
ncbi:small subunit ribosomal protein S28e [Pancytospora philotis]|nr:small subunit ribosomal protein S28e [Pancytospora philotis]